MRTGRITCISRALLRVSAAGLFIAVSAVPANAAPPQAPFGDKVSGAIVNYNRATPYIATAGLIKEGGVAELNSLGFTAILDLRGPEEGTAEERRKVVAAGLRYYNIPVTMRTPSDDQVRTFAALAEDPANYPMLVHCVSANRTGAVWTMYRVLKGVPFDIAIEEGRTAGLTSREKAVRKRLGQPPLEE